MGVGAPVDQNDAYGHGGENGEYAEEGEQASENGEHDQASRGIGLLGRFQKNAESQCGDQESTCHGGGQDPPNAANGLQIVF